MTVRIRYVQHWWASKLVVWRMNRIQRGQRMGNGIIRRVERLVRRVETVLRAAPRERTAERQSKADP